MIDHDPYHVLMIDHDPYGVFMIDHDPVLVSVSDVFLISRPHTKQRRRSWMVWETQIRGRAQANA